MYRHKDKVRRSGEVVEDMDEVLKKHKKKLVVKMKNYKFTSELDVF